jgi:hypothetical protein
MVRDGLPSNKVYCASQDSKGFIWIGTDNGLARFNGSEFKTFTTEDGLPDNEVLSVGEDYIGRLWVFCFKQAPCYFYKNKLYTSKNDSFLAQYFNNPNLCRYQYEPVEKRVLIFMALNEKNAVIENFKIQYLPFSVEKGQSNIGSINFFNTNNTDYFLYKDTIFNFRSKNHPMKFSFMGVSSLYFDNGKKIGIGYNFNSQTNVIFKIDNDTFKIIKTLSGSGFSGIYSNMSGVNLIMNDSGYLCSLNLKTFNLEKNLARIESGRFSTGMVDLAGNKWICTHDNGLFVFPNHSAEFLDTKTDKGAGCIAFNRKDGNVALGFENKVIHIFDKDLKDNKIALPIAKRIQSRITRLLFLKDELYVGGDFELVKINIKTKKTTKYTSINNGLIVLNIKDIEPADSIGFLIGSTMGAGYFSIRENKITDMIWNTRTVSIARDGSGNYYLGTINGLFNRKKGNTAVVKLKTKTALDESRITDIKIDKLGKVWIATAQFGIFILNHSTLVNISAAGKSGYRLSNNQIKNIYFDSEGSTWITTVKGLNRLTFDSQLGKYKVEIINLPFGLPDENINDCIVIGNEVYVVTLSGAFRFAYQKNHTSTKPKIIFTDLLCNNQPYDFVNNKNLSFNESTITIGFTPILYTKLEYINYKYRMVGYNNNWLLTKNNKIDFLNLGPGNYKFEVRVINSLTGEMSNIERLGFTIRTPWFKQLWFILFAICLSVFLMGWIIRLRIEGIHKKAEINNNLNKQVAEMEMQALRAHMNPHFIFNALSAIQNYYSNNEEEKANEYMFKFSGLIRKMLDYSKDNFIPLDEEIDLITNYMLLEQMRFEDMLEFKLHIDNNLDPSDYKLPSLMLQPLLENAVNHGVRTVKGIGIIELRLLKTESGLQCEVKDNGIGIIKAEELKKKSGSSHKSKGLEMLLKRIESINQLYGSKVTITVMDISDFEPDKTGTAIILDFPFFISELNS